MSKKNKFKEETDLGNAGDVAETTPEATPEAVSNADSESIESESDEEVRPTEETEKIEFKSIESESDAIAFVSQEFPHLKGKNLFVTQDKNVFEPENISSGANHADKNNLKSFRIKA